jgi:hypothetical protein
VSRLLLPRTWKRLVLLLMVLLLPLLSELLLLWPRGLSEGRCTAAVAADAAPALLLLWGGLQPRLRLRLRLRLLARRGLPGVRSAAALGAIAAG